MVTEMRSADVNGWPNSVEEWADQLAAALTEQCSVEWEGFIERYRCDLPSGHVGDHEALGLDKSRIRHAERPQPPAEQGGE